MNAYNYVASAQIPTAINTAVKGNFINKARTDLIVSKETYIEVYNVENDMLTLVYEFNLYGRIEALETCQLQGRDTCSLFVFVEGQYCVLSYQRSTGSIITEQSGHPAHHPARQADDIFVRTIGRERNLVVASIYSGLLHVFPITSTSSGKGKAKAARGTSNLRSEPFAIRIDEFLILSMVALDYEPEPTVAVLYVDDKERRLIKTYKLSLRMRGINEQAQTFQTNARSSDYLIIPGSAPYDCFVAISDSIITCHDTKSRLSKSTSINFTIMTAHSEFINDGQNSMACYLSDTGGMLYVLRVFFSQSNKACSRISFDSFGSIVRATALLCLENNRMFIASAQADSMLVNLDSRPITVLDELASLAPITDFCLFDLDKQGRQTMVCCSGAENNGSLRMVQDGVGFLPQVELPMTGVKGLWTLKQSADTSSLDNTLVVATVHNTRVLYIPDGSNVVEELSMYSAFRMEETTLAISQVDNLIVHVTPSGVRLVENGPGGVQLDEWRPSLPGHVITTAAANQTQCVLSYGFGELLYFEVQDGRLVKRGSKKMDCEVSCLDINALSEDDTAKADYVAVGLWGGDHVQLLRLSDLSTVGRDSLSGALVPRSVVLAEMDQVRYLFLTLGDGQLVYYRFGSEGLSDKKQITLGTHSVTLHKLFRGDHLRLFAASDRSTMITSDRQHDRLIFSGVNAREIRACLEFNSVIHNGVILATDKSLVFGRINPVRKLHITKIPLEKQMARRILYHEESKTIAVGTSTTNRNIDDGSETYTGWLRVFDARTLQALHTYDLLEHEVVESMCCVYMEEFESDVVFVGTAITNPEEKDQLSGRVLAFQVTLNYEYKLLDAVSVPGVVYSMKPYLSSLVMSVNGSIYFLDSFKPEEETGQKLRLAPKLHNNVIAVSMDTQGDALLVGDMMASVSLVKPDDSAARKLKKVAADYNPGYMTAVKILNDDVFLGADASYNFILLQQRPGANDESRRLEITGEYHVGDLVNCIKQGSIAHRSTDEEEEQFVNDRTVLYGTVSGAIGVITSLEQDQYEFLSVVQQNILRVRPSIGKLDHRAWRMFNNGVRKAGVRGFIDGDLVESFLHLSYDDKEKVVKGSNGGELLPCDVVRLQDIVEKLTNNR